MSSWRSLLDEFAEEGSVDCTIMGHQLDRVGLTPGADGSGLRNLNHVTATSPSFSAWHLVLQKMIENDNMSSFIFKASLRQDPRCTTSSQVQFRPVCRAPGLHVVANACWDESFNNPRVI